MPDFSDLMVMDQDWDNTPYAGAKVELPCNLPPAKGRPAHLFTYADANLMHYVHSGKAVTAILHFINKTPFDWFSKKQLTVNTARLLGPKVMPQEQRLSRREQARPHYSISEYLYVALPSFLATTRPSSAALPS